MVFAGLVIEHLKIFVKVELIVFFKMELRHFQFKDIYLFISFYYI